MANSDDSAFVSYVLGRAFVSRATSVIVTIASHAENLSLSKPNSFTPNTAAWLRTRMYV